jgi:hypothetical protein
MPILTSRSCPAPSRANGSATFIAGVKSAGQTGMGMMENAWLALVLSLGVLGAGCSATGGDPGQGSRPAPSCGSRPDGDGGPCTCPGTQACAGPQSLWFTCQKDGAWVETDASCLGPTYTAWYCSPTRGPSPVTDSGADDPGDDAPVCQSPSLCEAPMVQPPCPQNGPACPVTGWACVTPPGSSDAGDDGGPPPDGGVADAMGVQ